MTRYSYIGAITHARRNHPTPIIRRKYGNLLLDSISFDLFFLSVALNYTGLKSGGSVQEGVERDKAHEI